MRAGAPKTPSRRLYIFAALLFLWILVICFRLVRLQVVKYGFFMQLADRQQHPDHSGQTPQGKYLRPQWLSLGHVD